MFGATTVSVLYAEKCTADGHMDWATSEQVDKFQLNQKMCIDQGHIYYTVFPLGSFEYYKQKMKFNFPATCSSICIEVPSIKL